MTSQTAEAHPMARPGLREVALLAGVSSQTVSRALNGHPRVAAETRERITTAAAELGYRRNLAALALATRRSLNLGLISAGTTLWGPASAASAIERATRRAGYFLHVTATRTPEHQELVGAVDHLQDGGVEGIIVLDAHAIRLPTAGSGSRVPLIVVTDQDITATRATVGIDHSLGAAMAVHHLVELGHSTIAHVAGPSTWGAAVSRRHGWAEALRHHDLRTGPVLRGDWSAESGHAAGLRILTHRPRPTAVFVANDLMALGVLKALRQQQISVPRDMSIVAFDDSPGSSHFIPALTTVRQDFDQLGTIAVSAVLDALDGRPTRSVRVPPQLVIRESTGPAKATGQ